MPTRKKIEQPLTLSEFKIGLTSQLNHFYNELVEPNLKNTVAGEVQNLRDEINQKFDFLFKKFEDLRQEYILVNAQMKRFDDNDYNLAKQVADLKTKAADLQKQIENLEQRL